MKKLPFGKMLFLTLIAFFTFNTLNAATSVGGLNSETSANDNGQTYTALLRCRVCHQENFVEYCGYYMSTDHTYFYVSYISCQACGSVTEIDKIYHISDLDENRIVIIY